MHAYRPRSFHSSPHQKAQAAPLYRIPIHRYTHSSARLIYENLFVRYRRVLRKQSRSNNGLHAPGDGRIKQTAWSAGRGWQLNAHREYNGSRGRFEEQSSLTPLDRVVILVPAPASSRRHSSLTLWLMPRLVFKKTLFGVLTCSLFLRV